MSEEPNNPDPNAESPDARKPKPVEIEVNNKPVEMPSHSETGLAIKEKADVPADFTLYIKHGKELTEVADEQIIELHHKEKFIAVSGQDVS
jgi:hypothetical protein